jgi:hypothetical protein
MDQKVSFVSDARGGTGCTSTKIILEMLKIFKF